MLRYTCKQRRHESGEARRAKEQNRLKPDAVRKAEEQLSQFNSRTPSLAKYQDYLRAAQRNQAVLDAFVSEPGLAATGGPCTAAKDLLACTE